MEPGATPSDGDGFGDSGRFGTVAAGRREVHWPTVLVAGAVAAVVSSLMLTLGVIGLHRGADRPAEVVVAVDPRAGTAAIADPAAAPRADAPADHTPEAEPAPGEPGRQADGGGLSAATGSPAPPPTDSTAAPGDPPQPVAPDAPAPSAWQDAPPAPDAGGDRPATGWTPPGPLPADFAVTADEPTLDDLNAIVHLLVATPASDEAKARNLEAGHGGVMVPKTVYNLGIFRAPQGWKRITGPLERDGDTITATLHSASAGRPGITTRVVFVRGGDGVWTLSSRSVCEGVRTVGLPVGCGA